MAIYISTRATSNFQYLRLIFNANKNVATLFLQNNFQKKKPKEEKKDETVKKASPTKTTKTKELEKTSLYVADLESAKNDPVK